VSKFGRLNYTCFKFKKNVYLSHIRIYGRYIEINKIMHNRQKMNKTKKM